MAVFRKALCSRKGCTYWRVKLDSPEHGQNCPKCGSKVRQASNYTIQWYEGGQKVTETLETGNRRDADRILREKESGAADANKATTTPATTAAIVPQQASANNVSTPELSPPFETVAEEFFKIRNVTVRAKKRERIIVNHLNRFFGELPIATINKVKVAEYIATRLQQTVIHGMVQVCRDGTPFRRKVEPRLVQKSTVGRELSLLSLLFDYAEAEEYVRYASEKKHPLYKIKKEKSREVKHPVTLQQLNSLYQALGVWLAYLYEFIFEVGCRPGEAMALRWVDLLLEKKIAQIKTKNRDAEEEIQTLHLSARAIGIIKQQPRISEFVFANPDTKTRWVSIGKRFRKTAIALGLVYPDGPLRPHDLRHARLREGALANLNNMILMTISRHRDPRSLKRYTGEATPEAVQSGFALIEQCRATNSAT